MSFCLTRDREHSGSEVECLTGEQGIESSSLIGVTEGINEKDTLLFA